MRDLTRSMLLAGSTAGNIVGVASFLAVWAILGHPSDPRLIAAAAPGVLLSVACSIPVLMERKGPDVRYYRTTGKEA